MKHICVVFWYNFQYKPNGLNEQKRYITQIQYVHVKSSKSVRTVVSSVVLLCSA